jgi:hypothetical protein
MAERLDAVVAREYSDRDGNKKTSWTRIGSAWPTKNGGWSITLDALPTPTMGERGLETRILLMEPKPRDDKPAKRQQSYAEQSGGTSSYGTPLDDEIPFAPEFR